MAGEIAAAYVRIRPQLSDFKQQTVSGIKSTLTGVNTEVKSAAEQQVAAADETIAANEKVRESYAGIGTGAKEASAGADAMRSSVLSLGKVVGVAFGADIALRFTKSLVSSAASLQKQVEVIKAEFGSAGDAITKFGEGGAAALGISANAADSTAARMGILFNNLKIGKQTAADATVNLIKLAGSISAIRGIDPGVALKNLPLAIAGNLRSLKQLGIATDQNQLKIAAFKLGLTQSITQALTPAQRALAVVAIATANLGGYMDQAKAHAGDYANVQQRLNAEWSNAKDRLGTGLLPLMVKLATFLANILPGAVKYTIRAFSDLSDAVKNFASFAAPVFKPIVAGFNAIKQAFSSGGGGIGQLKQEFAQLSPVAKAAAVAIGAIGIALAATLAAAFPITATVLVIAGLAIAMDEAYKHSARFRDIVADLKAWLTDKLVPALEALAAKVAPTFAVIESTVKKVFGDVVVIIGQAVKVAEYVWTHFGATIKSVAETTFNAALRVIQDDFKILGNLFDFVKNVLTGKWQAAWDDLKSIASEFLDIIKTEISTFGTDIVKIFDGIWNLVQTNMLMALNKVVQIASAIIGKITGAISAFSSFFGGPKVSNPLSGLSESIEKRIKDIQAGEAAKSLADAVAKNTAAALRAKTTDPAIAVAADQVGQSVKKKITDAVTTGATAGTTAATTQAVDAGVQNAQAALNTLKQKLRETIAQNAIDIANTVREAKANLLSIGQTLADQIGQVIDQPLTVAAQRLQTAQDKLALVFDTQNARLQAQANTLNQLQGRLGLLNDKRSLAQLRNEVALPGGKRLSTDPKQALAELQSLARGANQLNRPAIEGFILQYQQALLQVSQDKLGLKQSGLNARRTASDTRLSLKQEQLQIASDTAAQLKIRATREINDLTANLARGAITLRTFNKKLAGLLAADHLSYKKAGSLLGSAFALGFRASVTGIARQAAALAAGPQLPGTGQEPKIIRPELTVLKDHLKVARQQETIANKTLALQKKQAAAAAKQAATLKAIHDTQIGGVTPSGKNPGKASKTTRELSGTTG